MARRFKKTQIDALKLAFAESEHLTRDKKLHLVRITGLDMEQVSNWFNRERARKRAKESILDLRKTNSELKKSLQECQETQAKLKKELQESKMREADAETENQRLKGRLIFLEHELLSDPLTRFNYGSP